MPVQARWSRVAVALLLVGTAGVRAIVAQGERAGDTGRAADEARIRKRLAEWVEQTRAGDRLAAAEIWAPDLIGWYPGQPEDTYAREQELARKQRAPDAPRSIPDVTVEEVMVSGDLAVVRDVWRITRIAGTDTTTTTLRGYEVWRRQPDGKWRIGRYISAPEPAATQRSSGLAPAADSGYVRVEGGRLFYRAAGRGRPVVFVGLGGGVDSRIWQSQMNALSDRYRVIAYDARGFGRSDAPARPYSNAADLVQLVRALDLRPACVVGLSAGGGVAIDAVLLEPARFNCLVVVGSVVGGTRFSEAFLARERRNAVPAERADYHGVADNWIADPYSMPTAGLAVRAHYRDLRLDPGNLRVYGYPESASARVAQPPAVGRLGEIRTPTLVVIGARDHPDIVRISEVLARDIPGARRTIVPDAGHLLPLERPHEVTRMLDSFIGSLAR